MKARRGHQRVESSRTGGVGFVETAVAFSRGDRLLFESNWVMSSFFLVESKAKASSVLCRALVQSTYAKRT